MRYAMQQTPAPTRRSHFRFVRTSGVLCISCWCGKVAALETRNINVFVKRCNDFGVRRVVACDWMAGEPMSEYPITVTRVTIPTEIFSGELMSSNPVAAFTRHPLLLLNMPRDTERWQCARYLHHLQTQRQTELEGHDILDAIERCRCHPGDVGRELAHADRLH